MPDFFAIFFIFVGATLAVALMVIVWATARVALTMIF
jgi:hypothetical protein